MVQKVALVTGAAKRMGRVIAMRLARGAYTLALHHQSSRNEAAELAAEIGAAGGTALPIQADLTDVSSPDRLIDRCFDAFGLSLIHI